MEPEKVSVRLSNLGAPMVGVPLRSIGDFRGVDGRGAWKHR